MQGGAEPTGVVLQRRRTVAGIKQQIVDVIEAGNAPVSGGLDPVEEVGADLQPAQDHRISPPKRRVLVRCAEFLLAKHTARPAQGLELLLLLFNAVEETLRQPLGADQQPAARWRPLGIRHGGRWMLKLSGGDPGLDLVALALLGQFEQAGIRMQQQLLGIAPAGHRLLVPAVPQQRGAEGCPDPLLTGQGGALQALAEFSGRLLLGEAQQHGHQPALAGAVLDGLQPGFCRAALMVQHQAGGHLPAEQHQSIGDGLVLAQPLAQQFGGLGVIRVVQAPGEAVQGAQFGIHWGGPMLESLEQLVLLADADQQSGQGHQRRLVLGGERQATLPTGPGIQGLLQAFEQEAQAVVAVGMGGVAAAMIDQITQHAVGLAVVKSLLEAIPRHHGLLRGPASMLG